MRVIKNIYFYLFAAVGLVFVLIGLVQLIQLGLRVWVFPQADVYPNYPMPSAIDEKTQQQPSQEALDEYQRQQLASRRQQDATSGIAFLAVGIPLFWFHFRIIRRDLKEFA